MQNKKGLYLIPYIVLVAVMVFEILPLMYFNLFPKTFFMDQDYAKIVRHIIEMGDKHRILLPGWDYLTTGEFDCAAPIALLIYMISGNIYVGFGIANIVNIFLWGYLIYRLLGAAGVDLKFRLLAIAMVILPYDFGMLSYTNMMFFCGGQYVYKTMVPILFVLALTIPSGEWKKPGNLLIYVLLFFLSFLTALSGGLYVLLCGIAPIVFCLFVCVISGKYKDGIVYKVVLACAVVITALIGRKLCVIVGIDPFSSSMNIRNTKEYTQVLESIINYMIDIFNPFLGKTVPATSFEGIVSCTKWVIVFIVLLGLLCIPKAFGIYLCADKEENKTDVRSFVVMMLISVFAWNLLIMFMTVSSPRYHLIGLIPLMMVSITVIEDFWNKCGDVVKFLFPLAIAACVVMINYNSVRILNDSYYVRGDKYYGVSMDECSDLISYLDANDIGTVFFVDNSELPEFLRTIDLGRVYETYVSASGSVINYDFYISERDRSAYTDRNVILVKEDVIEQLPDYITDNYKKSGTFGKFEMLMAETNPIDGIVKIDSEISTVDLATTPEYKHVGQIDGSGYLHTTDTGNVLESAILRVNKAFSFKVKYSLESDASAVVKVHEFDDYYGRDEGVSYELDPDSDEIEISVTKPANYLIVVEKFDNKEMIVKEIVFN